MTILRIVAVLMEVTGFQTCRSREGVDAVGGAGPRHEFPQGLLRLDHKSTLTPLACFTPVTCQ